MHSFPMTLRCIAALDVCEEPGVPGACPGCTDW